MIYFWPAISARAPENARAKGKQGNTNMINILYGFKGYARAEATFDNTL